MIRLAIVVEGETEEEFVTRVLTPHLQAREVDATPRWRSVRWKAQ